MLRIAAHLIARLLPRHLRDAHGDEIARDIDRRFRDGRRVSTLADVAGAVLRERRATAPHPAFARRHVTMSSLPQDIRFAVRARTPGNV